MPSDTNMRTVFVDNSTTPGDVLGRQQPRPPLVKVEPLD